MEKAQEHAALFAAKFKELKTQSAKALDRLIEADYASIIKAYE